MLTAKETSNLLNISTVRLKQILKNDESYKYERTNENNGLIKIHPETVRKLLQERNNFRYPKTAKKIIFGSQKGGVSKTLTTLHVAIRLAESRGCRCLIIDQDFEGHSSSFLLPENISLSETKTLYEVIKDNEPIENVVLETRYPNVSIIPSKGLNRRIDKLLTTSNPKTLIAKLIKPLEKKFDFIFFDVSPTFSPMISSCYLNSDVYLVTDSSLFSLEALRMTHEDIIALADEYEAKTPKMFALMTRYNKNRKASSDAWNTLINNFSNELTVLPVKLTESADMQNATNEGKTVFEIKSTSEIKNNIDELIELIFPIEEANAVIH